jgi:hypothetical protein
VYEANEYAERPIHHAAKWLVIWGVVVESFCTISLFVFDERISNAQEGKIIDLEGQIAGANQKALDARTVAGNAVDSLDSLKNRMESDKTETSNALTDVQNNEKEIASAASRANLGLRRTEAAASSVEADLKRLAEEEHDFEESEAPRLYNQAPAMQYVKALSKVPVLVGSVSREEPEDVAASIQFVFGNAGWTLIPVQPRAFFPIPEGIEIRYRSVMDNPFGNSDARAAAVAICEDLAKQQIEAHTFGVPFDHGQPLGHFDWPAELPPEGVAILVGKKPKHFFLKKFLKAQGSPNADKIDSDRIPEIPGKPYPLCN